MRKYFYLSNTFLMTSRLKATPMCRIMLNLFNLTILDIFWISPILVRDITDLTTFLHILATTQCQAWQVGSQ
jgi:hypothetical protein